MLEHDEDDRYITQAVLDELKADIAIKFVSNSNDLFQNLDGKLLPDLLLITYRAMPLNAIEILKKLKSNERLRQIPVVVLSGVAKPSMIEECYDAGASSFVTKPSTGHETTSKIKTFLEYWFKTVELPQSL
jgi:CheY-like chemotaxis protein